MKFNYHFLALSLFIIFATACKSDSLENYLSISSESPNFFVTNIPVNILKFNNNNNLDKQTPQEIKKMNVLVYKNNLNIEDKSKEFDKVQKIINKKKYKILTKIKNKGYNISFAYQGKPSKINEVIFLGKDQDYNFIIGLLKGKNINLNKISKALQDINNLPINLVLDTFKINK